MRTFLIATFTLIVYAAIKPFINKFNQVVLVFIYFYFFCWFYTFHYVISKGLFSRRKEQQNTQVYQMKKRKSLRV